MKSVLTFIFSMATGRIAAGLVQDGQDLVPKRHGARTGESFNDYWHLHATLVIAYDNPRLPVTTWQHDATRSDDGDRRIEGTVFDLVCSIHGAPVGQHTAYDKLRGRIGKIQSYRGGAHEQIRGETLGIQCCYDDCGCRAERTPVDRVVPFCVHILLSYTSARCVGSIVVSGLSSLASNFVGGSQDSPRCCTECLLFSCARKSWVNGVERSKDRPTTGVSTKRSHGVRSSE